MNLVQLKWKLLVIISIIRSYKYGKVESPTIISDDCWGSEFYRIHRLPYFTPFIGLYVEPSSYLYLIENIRKLINEKLNFIEEKNKPFPVAFLGDKVKLNFMHYSSISEAQSKWERRCERINWNHIYYKIDFSPREPFGASGYLESDVKRWNQIATHNHIALINDFDSSLQIKNSVFVENWEVDAIKSYYHSLTNFSVEGWLKTGKFNSSIPFPLKTILSRL